MTEKVYLKDIAGYKDEKKEAENIIDILKNHEMYASYGAYVPKGLILSGKPGVGKTMLAKAIATEANVPFFTLDATDEEEDSVISSIKEVFAKAKENKPSIIFIDELDEIVTCGFEDNSSRKALKALLTELDGTDSSDGVLVIATTNSYRLLPSSLLRSGRMDKTIEFSLPDLANREELYNLYLSKNKFLANVDGKTLAIKSGGFSCADIKNLINSTLIKCIQAKEEVTTKKMEDNIPSIMFKDIRRNMDTPTDSTVLYHEIGHFLVGYELSNTVGEIICERYRQAGGFVRFNDCIDIDDSDLPFFSRRKLKSTSPMKNANNKDAINQLAIFLGGRAAEEIFIGKISCGATSDIENAKGMVTSLLLGGCYGFDFPSNFEMHKRFISERKLRKYEKATNKLLNKAYKIAKKSIKKNMTHVEEIYKQLEEKKKLSSEELKAIMNIA